MNAAPRRRPLSLWPVLLILAALAGTTVGAAPEPGGPYLKPSQAFGFRVSAPNRRTLRVHFRVHDGYYLYRRQFRFSLAQPPAGVHITQTRLSAGLKKHDKFFGEVEIYRHSALATLRLRVRYQGCAEQGLCYPPQTHLAAVHLAQAGNHAGLSAPDTSSQSRLAALIGSASLAWMALTFLGLGVALAFTPCVLPMIPILSGLIVGQGRQANAARGFLLSGAYAVAMAAAYTVFGVIAGLAGRNIQATLQAAPAIAAFSALFVLLALSMFGLYELQLPRSLRNRLLRFESRQRGGSLAGAAAMGFTAALIVGPCVSPALAGALLYIGQTGNAALGGLALFALGLGMGLPLVAIGTLGGHWLPRSGAWMERVRQAFGFVFLGLAIWMLARIVPAAATLGLWAALLLAAGVSLGALKSLGHRPGGWRRLGKGAGVAALVYGVILAVGAASGGQDPLRPLARTAHRPLSRNAAGRAGTPAFQPVHNVQQLQDALSAASARHRPAMLEFDAAWCLSCKHMQHDVLNNPEVRRRLQHMTLLRADVTANSPAERRLMQRYSVIGPPTFLFFDAQGRELRGARLVGEAGISAFQAHLQRILQHDE